MGPDGSGLRGGRRLAFLRGGRFRGWSGRPDDRWSALSRSYHAFLQDRQNGIVFTPSREGGAVFGYEGGLSRVATIDTDDPARPAMYVSDYLYVFAGDELIVVDETDWPRETTVDL